MLCRHKFFNTNNLWVNLPALKKTLDANNGVLKLPLIKNKKTVNPRDSDTPAVFQLETAMGSAIECFDDAGAVVVPRDRFAPVKTCNDLFALRSDVYEVCSIPLSVISGFLLLLALAFAVAFAHICVAAKLSLRCSVSVVTNDFERLSPGFLDKVARTCCCTHGPVYHCPEKEHQ